MVPAMGRVSSPSTKGSVGKTANALQEQLPWRSKASSCGEHPPYIIAVEVSVEALLQESIASVQACCALLVESDDYSFHDIPGRECILSSFGRCEDC